MSWLNEPVTPSTDFTSHGRISRVELIDHRPTADSKGRVFTADDVEVVTLSLQDKGRTLKVFLA